MRYLYQFVHLMVTLRIASEDRIPLEIRKLLQEEEGRASSNMVAGDQFVQSTKDVGFPGLLGRIETRKFEMIGLTLERCYDRKGPPYLKLRGQWARHDFATGIAEEFKEVRTALSTNFQAVLDAAGWSVIAYDNPYFVEGHHVQGAHSLSINANAPEWLLNPDATPVQVWDRPKWQDGAMKIARKPAHIFRINEESALEIVSV